MADHAFRGLEVHLAGIAREDRLEERSAPARKRSDFAVWRKAGRRADLRQRRIARESFGVRQ